MEDLEQRLSAREFKEWVVDYVMQAEEQKKAEDAAKKRPQPRPRGG